MPALTSVLGVEDVLVEEVVAVDVALVAPVAPLESVGEGVDGVDDEAELGVELEAAPVERAVHAVVRAPEERVPHFLRPRTPALKTGSYGIAMTGMHVASNHLHRRLWMAFEYLL